MAIAFSTKNTGTISSTSLTVALTAPSATYSLVVACCAVRQNTMTISGVTYGGVAMTPARTDPNTTASPDHLTAIYYIVNPAAGSANVVVSVSTSGPIFLDASSWTGTAPFVLGPVNGATGSSANPSVAVVPTVNGSLIIDMMLHESSTVESGRGASQTLIYSQDHGQFVTSSTYFIQSTAASYSMAHTIGADQWALSAASFAPSSSVGASATMTADTLTVTGQAVTGTATSPSAYEAEILGTSGLAGYWRLGEPSGTTAVDASGNGMTGTIAGSPTMGTTGLLTGDADTAITFDGSDDTVSMGDVLDVTGTAPFTIEAWVSRTADNAFRVIASKYDGTNGWLLIWNGSYQPYIERNGGGVSNNVIATTALALNTTYHIVAKYDTDQTLRIFINGVEDAAPVLLTSSVAGTSSPFRIGALSAGSNYAPAIIDDVAFYDVALDDATILNHYQIGTGAIPASATMTADALTVSGKALTATAGVGTVGTMTRDTLTVSGQSITATSGTSAFLTTATGTATGKVVTATATISASATLTADALTASGKVVTGTAESVVNATGTMTAGTVTVAGQDVTATSGTSATLTRDQLTVSGQDVTATGQRNEAATVNPSALTVMGQSLTATAQRHESATLTAGTATAAGQDVSATAQRHESATITAGSATVTGQVVTGTALAAGDALMTAAHLTTTGHPLTATGQRNESATVESGSATATGQPITGTGSTVIDATATFTAALATVTGRGVTATGQAHAAATLGAGILILVGRTITGTDGIIPITHWETFAASAPVTVWSALAPITTLAAADLQETARDALAPVTTYPAPAPATTYTGSAPVTTFDAED